LVVVGFDQNLNLNALGVLRQGFAPKVCSPKVQDSAQTAVLVCKAAAGLWTDKEIPADTSEPLLCGRVHPRAAHASILYASLPFVTLKRIHLWAGGRLVPALRTAAAAAVCVCVCVCVSASVRESESE
jgi:hypothetical protein